MQELKSIDLSLTIWTFLIGLIFIAIGVLLFRFLFKKLKKKKS